MFCRNCGNKLDDNDNFCPSCGTKVKNDNESVPAVKEQEIVAVQNNQIPQEDYSAQELIDYIGKAKLLEIRKYGLNNALNNLEEKSKQYRVKSVAQKYGRYDIGDNLDGIWNATKISASIVGLIVFAWRIIIIDASIILKIILALTGLFLFAGSFWTALVIAILSSVITAAIVFLVGIIISTIMNIVKNADLAKSEVQSELIAEAENNERQVKLDELQQRKKEIRAELDETNNLLNKVYELDVLHNKYHNLIAVTTMYEYLETGRCFGLYGYTGAYNIYETELLQKTIIGKLDDILVSLDQVKRNQFCIYQAIQVGNSIAQAALENSYAVLENTRATLEASKQTANSAKITEYNSKRSAENSEILLYVEAFRDR